MGGYIDAAAGVLMRVSRQVEVAGANISNLDTAGYKRQTSYESVVATKGKVASGVPSLDMTPGKLVNTGNPYHLALLGSSFFVVASSKGVFYTRGGQFQRDGEGRLVTVEGFALQSQDGGDLVLTAKAAPNILRDGTVLEDGAPTGKVAVVELDPRGATYAQGGVIDAPGGTASESDAPAVQQGAYESSNVSMGSEMVSMMLALRQAETAQKLIGVYDELTGRVIDAFGQAGGA
jgi:flagellar basal body rod protein FlgG